MSSVTINLSDTFDQWRIKTNSLGSQNGDLSSLSTTAKGSLVDAINEIVASDSDDMENVLDDTTPQLGGDLDLNDFNIINNGSGASNITVTGTVTAQTFTGTIEVSTDQTPQLGGDLDLNGKVITGTGTINITGDGTFTGGTLSATNVNGTTINATTINATDVIATTSLQGQLVGSIASATTAVTQTSGDNSTKVATTSYVDAQVSTSASSQLPTNITNPADNDILQYDLASNRWVNTVLSISGASEGFAVGMAIALG